MFRCQSCIDKANASLEAEIKRLEKSEAERLAKEAYEIKA